MYTQWESISFTVKDKMFQFYDEIRNKIQLTEFLDFWVVGPIIRSVLA